jgi:O-antigen/teichoic acid export membrane protein
MSIRGRTSFGRFRSSRLVSGSGANFAALGAQLTIQLISVPVLSASLGVELYGTWLLLSTVPAYFILSDLGLTNAATNEMAIKAAADQPREVLTVFQSIAAIVLVSSILLTLLVTLFVAATAQIDGFWPSEIAPHVAVIPLLTAYAALFMISSLPIAALRATGYYARATLMLETSVFVEALGMLAAAVLSRNLVVAAATPLVIRLVTFPLMYAQLRRLRPYLYIGWSHAELATAKRLLPPALAVTSIPLGLSLSLQGTVIVVGSILGPAAVALFVPVRTASRFAVQAAGMVIRAMVPELAAARGRGDKATEDRLWRINALLPWLILGPAAAVFALLGGPAVALWSGGLLDPPWLFVAIMALTIVLHGSWFLNVMLLTASHDHVSHAKYIIGASALGLLAAIPLTAEFGLAGAAVSLVIGDLLLAVIVGLDVRRRTRRAMEPAQC